MNSGSDATPLKPFKTNKRKISLNSIALPSSPFPQSPLPSRHGDFAPPSSLSSMHFLPSSRSVRSAAILSLTSFLSTLSLPKADNEGAVEPVQIPPQTFSSRHPSLRASSSSSSSSSVHSNSCYNNDDAASKFSYSGSRSSANAKLSSSATKTADTSSSSSSFLINTIIELINSLNHSSGLHQAGEPSTMTQDLREICENSVRNYMKISTYLLVEFCNSLGYDWCKTPSPANLSTVKALIRNCRGDDNLVMSIRKSLSSGTGDVFNSSQDFVRYSYEIYCEIISVVKKRKACSPLSIQVLEELAEWARDIDLFMPANIRPSAMHSSLKLAASHRFSTEILKSFKGPAKKVEHTMRLLHLLPSAFFALSQRAGAVFSAVINYVYCYVTKPTFSTMDNSSVLALHIILDVFKHGKTNKDGYSDGGGGDDGDGDGDGNRSFGSIPFYVYAQKEKMLAVCTLIHNVSDCQIAADVQNKILTDCRPGQEMDVS